MPEINSAEIGFEKEISKAPGKMRGNIYASEYKSVVLELIFLKYISDKFEAKHDELVAERTHTPEIGTAIDDVIRAIERGNKRLKDILPKNFSRPELDKRRLGEMVDLFTNIKRLIPNHLTRKGQGSQVNCRAYSSSSIGWRKR